MITRKLLVVVLAIFLAPGVAVAGNGWETVGKVAVGLAVINYVASGRSNTYSPRTTYVAPSTTYYVPARTYTRPQRTTIIRNTYQPPQQRQRVERHVEHAADGSTTITTTTTTYEDAPVRYHRGGSTYYDY